MKRDMYENELFEKYTAEELAESFVFPSEELSKEEHEEFLRILNERRSKISKNEAFGYRVLGLKYRIEDIIDNETDQKEIERLTLYKEKLQPIIDKYLVKS